MGAAASAYAETLDGLPWDGKPLEFFGGETTGGAAVPPQFDAVKRRYLRKKKEGESGEALVEFGGSLLEDECLEVEFHDAGTWTRCVVRDTSHCHSVAGGADPTFMYGSHDPGAFLLTRTRSSKQLLGGTGQHMIRGVEETMRRKDAAFNAAKRVAVVFTDGSEAAHVAYVCAKTFVHGHEDTLSVITVASTKVHTSPNFKPKVIRDRYETDLTTFLPRKRWRFITIPASKVPTKDVVQTFVNDRAHMPCSVRTHPDPTLVLVGFSGRKTSAARDPTVIGQVADLSLRTLFCPTIVCKVAPRETGRHFVVLVEPVERSVRAADVLSGFLKDDDAVTFLHVLPDGALKNAPDTLMAMLGKWKARANFEFVENLDGRAISILDVLQNDPRPCFNDVDFVVVATRPKTEPGSVSDHLVRHYSRNIIIIKTVIDAPDRRTSLAARSGIVVVNKGRDPVPADAASPEPADEAAAPPPE